MFVCNRCYATGEKPHYLIFEDLVSQEFATIDKKVGLDYDHLILTVSTLAKWHATTAHLYAIVYVFRFFFCDPCALVMTHASQ